MRQRIKQALSSGDYTKALATWREYTAEMASAGPTAASLAEAAELIDWARPLLTAARTDAAERLRALHVAGKYRKLPNARSALFRASF